MTSGEKLAQAYKEIVKEVLAELEEYMRGEVIGLGNNPRVYDNFTVENYKHWMRGSLQR